MKATLGQLGPCESRTLTVRDLPKVPARNGAEWRPSHFSSNPSGNTDQWYVWDIYSDLPPNPIFFGTMEDAGLLADALNERRIRQRLAAGDFDGF